MRIITGFEVLSIHLTGNPLEGVSLLTNDKGPKTLGPGATKCSWIPVTARPRLNVLCVGSLYKVGTGPDSTRLTQ